jgi:hypothetical protein
MEVLFFRPIVCSCNPHFNRDFPEKRFARLNHCLLSHGVGQDKYLYLLQKLANSPILTGLNAVFGIEL